MRARTKRKIKNILRAYRSFIFILALLFAVIVILNGNGENSLNPVESEKNSTIEVSISGEDIFKKVCMKCHTTPERYKSFKLYFGKPENVWEVGIRKMVTSGNVKLSVDQIKLLANYLSDTYRGG
ncbi:MAG: hypothetical protein ACK401_07850 [Archaeoglobaceae archaeon]